MGWRRQRPALSGIALPLVEQESGVRAGIRARVWARVRARVWRLMERREVESSGRGVEELHDSWLLLPSKRDAMPAVAAAQVEWRLTWGWRSREGGEPV